MSEAVLKARVYQVLTPEALKNAQEPAEKCLIAISNGKLTNGGAIIALALAFHGLELPDTDTALELFAGIIKEGTKS